MKGIYNKNSGQEVSRKLEKLKKLQCLPLQRKIKISNHIIENALKLGKPALLYSGGRDSTVLLDLLLKYKPDILVMYNDTTLGDKSCLNFIREYTGGLNYIETTADNPVEMWNEKGYFPILSKRGFTDYKKRIPGLRISPVQCCYQLKEKYANRVLNSNEINVVFWGNRAGESNRRKLSFVDNGFLFKPKKYKWFQCYPLQHYTDRDIEVYLATYIPDYPKQKTFESGCLCCCTDITYERNNISNLFLSNREKWENYMRCGFAKEIMKTKGYGELTDNEINEIIKKCPGELNRILKNKSN